MSGDLQLVVMFGGLVAFAAVGLVAIAVALERGRRVLIPDSRIPKLHRRRRSFTGIFPNAEALTRRARPVAGHRLRRSRAYSN